MQFNEFEYHYANSRWRTDVILKTALSQYISRELSNLDKIW